MKIKNIWIEDVRATYVNQEEKIDNFTFIVIFQKGLSKKYYKFMTNFPHFKICYLQERGFEVAPTDREENRKILQLAYGELKKLLATWELQADFRKQVRRRKKTQRRRTGKN